MVVFSTAGYLADRQQLFKQQQDADSTDQLPSAFVTASSLTFIQPSAGCHGACSTVSSQQGRPCQSANEVPGLTWVRLRRWERTESWEKQSVSAGPGAPQNPPGQACWGTCPPSP